MKGNKQKKTKAKQGSRCDKGETVEETYSNEESYENNGNADDKVVNPIMLAIYTRDSCTQVGS